MKRLLVTGSRSWNDREIVYTALAEAWARLGKDVVLVHGGADGADRWCQTVWLEAGLPEEVHHTVWYPGGQYDWRAGFTRNAYMVALGADAALAFDLPCMATRCRRTEPHVSHGTEDCIERIEEAQIPLWRWSKSH